MKKARNSAFLGSDEPRIFFPLINVKMPTIVGILSFMSRKNFMLSWVEHEKSYSTKSWGLVYVKWVHLQGKQLYNFLFCFSSQFRSTLKGKNLLFQEQILSLKSRPLFGRLIALRSKQEVTKIVSLHKYCRNNMEVCPHTFREVMMITSG